MIVTFEGWSRNCGMTQVMTKVLKNEHFTKNPFPINKNEIKVEVHDPEVSERDGVSIYFDSDMRFNGRYLSTISLSTKEIIRLFRATLGKKQALHLFKELAAG